MTNKEKKLAQGLWGPEDVQQRLQEMGRAHYSRLTAPTPRAEKLREKFVSGWAIIADEPFLDGRKIYDLLLDTDGMDYALEIYRDFHGLPGWRDDDQIPELYDIAAELDNPPPLAEELIAGILRRGHQMLIAGGSKTSKSFLTLELALSVATGKPWLGTYDCTQGNVLYINGEIDRASCDRRIMAILERMGIDRMDLRGKMDVMTARGYDLSAAQVITKVSRGGKSYALIILDPIYTLADVTDENNAAEVRKMLREIGKLATTTGAALVAIHHHSKGAQGGKRSIDRASGSGVFGRWFDAVVDLTTLHIPDGVAEQSRTPESVPMRLEYDLRDFKQPKPLSIWWHYPIHIPDASGELAGLLVDGDPRGNLAQYQTGQSEEQRQTQRDADMGRAIAAITADGREPTVKAVADELGVSDRSVRGWLDKSSTIVRNGRILGTENRK